VSKNGKQRRTRKDREGRPERRGSAAVATIDALPAGHAEQIFRMAPPAGPIDPGILYSRGFIDFESGRRETAAGVGGQAMLIENGNPSYHYKLGNALRMEGRMADAAAQYERALLLQPDYAEAHNNLGAILDGQGQRDQAVAHYERALAVRPGYADAHCNLGLTLAAQGRLAEAILHYERAIELNPRHLNAHNNLGLTLAAQGRLAEAIEHLERVIALNPNHGSAHYSLGVAQMAQGRIAEATAHFERALQLSPGHADLHNNLGVALAEQGRIAEATVHYERALLLSPGYAAAHGNLGTALGEQGRTREAVAQLARAIELDPRQADAHNSLGNLCKDEGRFDDAMAHYARAIAIRPDYGEAYLNRSEIKRFQPGDAEMAALEALAQRDDLSVNKALHIHFALAKALEDTGEYARSFAHLRTGNALKRGQFRYDEMRALGMLRRIAAVFDGSLLDRFRGAGDPSQVPVFVLGMPRSGSTLVEQILASHPQVHGAGELSGFETAASSIFNTGAGYPESVSALDGVTPRRLGQAYLAGLPALRDGGLRIVDKLPGNFLNIGLIRLLLPNARIVHTMRRPVDTCLSCYSKLFTSGHRYTYDLAELGRFYRGYRELMAHWRSVLPPGAMLDVAYEDVVGDLEGQARRLVDYCGLAWDDRCLRFHETRRPVRTASAVQVRQPLFQSSLERWRKYEAEIAPLLEELGGIVPD